MIQKIKKFSQLSGEQKRLFLEAWFRLVFFRTALMAVTFKRLTRSLEQLPRNGELNDLPENQRKMAISVGEAISKAANNTPWDSSCLAQSLTAQRMLQQLGIPGVFYLGVKKDESVVDNMIAHAWSQCGDTIITGHQGHEAFTVISVYRWG